MKLSEIDTNNLDNELIKKVFFNVPRETYHYADYVVVYGCHIKELLDERLNYALEVLKKHDFGKIIVTDGIGVNGDFNEAEYMKKYLLENLIDESKIVMENKSTTTEENNLNILEMLNLELIDEPLNIVLVSQEFHLSRIMLHWEKILHNKNIHFYYDYVLNSSLSFKVIINESKYLDF